MAMTIQANLFPPEQTAGAILSPDRLYRYALWRIWDHDLPRVNFVMMNPSTADERDDDPTIRRCVGFARAWGYGGVSVTNLFAYRATDPATLKAVADPIGPDNDREIAEEATIAKLVVCAWGEHGTLLGRAERVVSRLRELPGASPHYLKLNKSGSPAHPLYLPGGLQPTPWT
jgi:hypothetical protein